MNIAGIDLNLLVAFDALMKDGAVTRAAARVGRSQPAMSNALQRLRELFDDDLFVRTRAGMEPTPRARELAATIAPALAQLARGLAPPAPFDPATTDRAFVAGMIEYAEIALIEKLSTELRARAPNADLCVAPITWRDYAEQLDAGTIDVALGNLKRHPPRFDSRHLLDDRLVCLARARHPAFRKRLTLDAYVRLAHVLVSPSGQRHGSIDEALRERGLSRRVVLTVRAFLAVPLALRDSDLVATLPARTAKRLAAMAKLSVHALPLEQATRIDMVWHRREASEPAQSWFRALLAEVAAAS